MNEIVKESAKGTLSAKWRRETTVAVREFMRESMANVASRTDKEMKKLAVIEASWQQAMFKEIIPVDISFALPSVNMLRAIVDGPVMSNATISELFDSVATRTATRLWKEIGIGVAGGESTPDIVDRAARIGEMTKQDATAVVRTTINHISSEARELTYEQNDDLIKGVQIVATLDLRTTELCMSLDGQIYPPGEGERPPFHWNCRTTTVPVLKSWKEMGIDRPETEHVRAAMDGQVPARMTYGEWLKDQSAADQDEALGPVRAELFRQGAVEIDSFVDKSGKLLTLDELAKAEGIEKEIEEARSR